MNLEKDEAYNSELITKLTLTEINYISEYVGFNFEALYNQTNTKEHQKTAWFILQMFVFTFMRKIIYFFIEMILV